MYHTHDSITRDFSFFQPTLSDAGAVDNDLDTEISKLFIF